MQQLKVDAALRQKLGAAGCAAVSKKTISFVVADLLQWYQRGKETARRRSRQLFYRLLVPLLLGLLVPFTIGLFCFYNASVSSFSDVTRCCNSESPSLLRQVAVLKPFISFGEYKVTAHAPNSPLLQSGTSVSSIAGTDSSSGGGTRKDKKRA